MIMRVLLLLSLSWIMGLTWPIFSIAQYDISGRAIILIGGGLFLLAKSTREIHHRLEEGDEGKPRGARGSFSSVVIQIVCSMLSFRSIR
jgi:predicted tellurium resistance membrane protein TerC